MIACEYRQGTTCLQASDMAGITASTTDAACRVCLAEPTRINSVTASLALNVIPRPRPDDKKYLVALLKKHKPDQEPKSRGIVRIVCPNPNAIKPGNSGPISISHHRSRPRHKTHSDATLELFHRLWAELHSVENPTQEWFHTWQSKIPSMGCGCRNHLAAYIAANPVDFENFTQWAIDLHNSVNVRLEKPIWTSV